MLIGLKIGNDQRKSESLWFICMSSGIKRFSPSPIDVADWESASRMRLFVKTELLATLNVTPPFANGTSETRESNMEQV